MERCAETEIGTESVRRKIKSALSFTGKPIKSDAQPLNVSISVSVLVFVEPFHLSTGVQPQDSLDIRRFYKGKGQNTHLKSVAWDAESICLRLPM